MDIRKTDLEQAAEQGLVARDKVDSLWRFLGAQQGTGTARFDFTHVTYYFGALVVIAAMAWYLSLAWDRSDGWQISLTALIYAGVFGAVGALLRSRRIDLTLGGLLLVVAVCMTPLFLYGIQRQMGLWPDVLATDPTLHLRKFVPRYPPDQFVYNGMVLQGATAICAIIVLRWVRFPFLIVPALVALWLVAVEPTNLSWLGEERWSPRWVSAVYGVLVIAMGLGQDRAQRNSFGFWMHLLGGAALWGAVAIRDDGSQWLWAGIALFSLLYACFGVVIRRRVYTALGAVGMFLYFHHLSHTIFADSLWYPFVLTGFGILVILAGLWYNRRREPIEAALRTAVPPFLRRLLP